MYLPSTSGITNGYHIRTTYATVCPFFPYRRLCPSRSNISGRSLRVPFFTTAGIRNGYAHADWSSLRADAYIKVKTRSSRSGILHRYKRIDKETADSDITYIVSVGNRLVSVHELVQDSIYGRVNANDAAGRTLPVVKYPVSAEAKPRLSRAYDEGHEDTLNALLALGYGAEEAGTALRNVPHGLSAREGIKVALRCLQADS